MTGVNWGILGTGRAARRFAKGLRRVGEARLLAVGSRDHERACSFARRFRVASVYSSYQELADDPSVDVVYVATPHSRHRTDTLLCLEAGKAVLCEKPLAIDATEAEEMISCARERGLFLMEAMWSRFLPAFVELRRILDGEELGEPRLVRADCCWRNPLRPEHRLFAPELGGGSLLDLGVYGVSLAALVLGGTPSSVSGSARLGSTGVDERGAAVLDWSGERLAVITCAIRAQSTNDAVVAGDYGTARLRGPFWRSTGLTVECEGRRRRRISARFRAPGFQYEALEVVRCLSDGLLESPVMPLEQSLEVMRTMDRIRTAWGLRYPSAESSGGVTSSRGMERTPA